MKIRFLIAALLTLPGSVGAVLIDLQNAEDGSDTISLNSGSGNINVVIVTYSIDTIPVSFVNTFLNTDDDNVQLVGVAGGQDWTYDRSSFVLPALLDDAQGNEYGLISGDQDGEDALPLGSATHIIDTLTVVPTGGFGTTFITFETGARNPQVFGPGPDYLPFVVGPPGFPGTFPNLLLLGDPLSNNSYFTITYIPEPAGIGMAAVALLLTSRARRMAMRS